MSDAANIRKKNLQTFNKKAFDVKFNLEGTHYEPIENIGAGAYGVVCSAHHHKTKETVAIKKIPDFLDILATAKRTYREIKILKHFKHDNVIAIREILKPKEPFRDIYVVLDLMESDLHRIIHSNQPLTDEHVRYFLYQVLRGLKYIHSARVIHRDLKPSNLLVNENCDLKIGDFGMARGESSSDETGEGQQHYMTQYVATRWYRAPELMFSLLSYTSAMDIWSVGCIFAEMLGRKQLFPGKDFINQLKLMIGILGTPPKSFLCQSQSEIVRDWIQSFGVKEAVPFNKLYPKAPRKAHYLLSKMLTFNPKERLTAEHALKHPYLSKYHDPDDEPICIPVFNFDFEKQNLTKDELKDETLKEIMEYHKPKIGTLTPILKPAPKTPNSPSAYGTGLESFLKLMSAAKTETESQSKSETCKTGLGAFLNQKMSNKTDTDHVHKVGKVTSTCMSGVLPFVNNQSSSAANLSFINQPTVKSINLTFHLNNKKDKVHQDDTLTVCNQDKTVVTIDTNSLSMTVNDVEMLSAKSDVQMLSAKITEDKTHHFIASTANLPAVQPPDVSHTAVPLPAVQPTAVQSSTVLTEESTGGVSMETKALVKQALLNAALKKKHADPDQQKGPITAYQRQKEREEKRRQKLQKAKERKRKQRERKAPQLLTDEDKNMLERWKKLQETPLVTSNAIHQLVENTKPNTKMFVGAVPANTAQVVISSNTARAVITSVESTADCITVTETKTTADNDVFDTNFDNFLANQGLHNEPVITQNATASNTSSTSSLQSLNRNSSSGSITSSHVTWADDNIIHPTHNAMFSLPEENGHLPSYNEAVQAKTLIPTDQSNAETLPTQSQSQGTTNTLLLDPHYKTESPLLDDFFTQFEDKSPSSSRDSTDNSIQEFTVSTKPASFQDINFKNEQNDSSSDLVAMVTKQFSKHQVEDYLPPILAVTPKGTGGGYGVLDLDQLLNETQSGGVSADKLDSAPLSASLIADWLEVTGNMDSKDMEALQRELELGSPFVFSDL